MDINFEVITLENLYIAAEIINSNPEYNVIENGRETRTEKDMIGEFLHSNSFSLLVKADDTYIGVIDYLMENPKNRTPWLGLLMIHGDYHGFGFGSQSYKHFETELVNRGTNRILLGVIKENKKAHDFWLSLGFSYYNTVISKNQKEIICYEKVLI
ncbi:MAG: GNAT family N-acetyltransferase [Bacillota bacterium]|nr:GNAT family N-acetyltransferase [Bacillota bacterium]